MRNAAAYARRVKNLFGRLKRGGSKANLTTTDDAMEVLLLGILSNFTTEQRAAAALDRLLEATVDLNDLRVTPVADMVACIGVDFPHCRAAAEEISQVLTSIFNRTHDLDLNFLGTFSRKSAGSFLDSLDGLSPHTKAFFKQRFLNTRAIPLDANMHTYLKRNECIAEDASVGDAQHFLSGVIKDRDAVSFYALLKRCAAAHAPRKGLSKVSGAMKRRAKSARTGRAPGEKPKRASRSASGRKKSKGRSPTGKSQAGKVKRKPAKKGTAKKKAAAARKRSKMSKSRKAATRRR